VNPSDLPETPSTPTPRKVAYVFLDEGGNFDFSPNGTQYFTLTSVRVFRPFPIDQYLTELRFDLIESGLELEYFHASEDRQATRDRVFKVIRGALGAFRVDSVIVEKRKTIPSLREERRFYPEILGHLLKHVVRGTNLSGISEFIIIADRYPNAKKRNAVEGAVKAVVKTMLPPGVRYRVLFQGSKSACGLQIADYFNWAIFRKWERNDSRSLDAVSPAVSSQIDIFVRDTLTWY
jgi:hypothetical protein